MIDNERKALYNRSEEEVIMIFKSVEVLQDCPVFNLNCWAQIYLGPT